MSDHFLKNKAFSACYAFTLFFGACGVVALNRQLYGVILFGYITAAVLILSPRLTDAMLPAMLLAVFSTDCYNSADFFLSNIPWLIPIAGAIIAHFKIGRAHV